MSYDVGTTPWYVTAADLNGDNIPDLVVSNQDSNDVAVLLGLGDGTFGDPQTITVGQSPHFIVAADFNGDGQIDLAVANSDSDTISILFNNSH